jgi:hypothetical protein
MARLPAHSVAPRSRWQGELPELAEISSSDVVFWEGSSRAPPTHQPQLDPDVHRDPEGQPSDGTGSHTEWVPEPSLVQQYSYIVKLASNVLDVRQYSPAYSYLSARKAERTYSLHYGVSIMGQSENGYSRPIRWRLQVMRGLQEILLASIVIQQPAICSK